MTWPRLLLISVGAMAIWGLAIGLSIAAFMDFRSHDRGVSGTQSTPSPAEVPSPVVDQQPPLDLDSQQVGATVPSSPLRTEGVDKLFDRLRDENERLPNVRSGPEPELTRSRDDPITAVRQAQEKVRRAAATILFFAHPSSRLLYFHEEVADRIPPDTNGLTLVYRFVHRSFVDLEVHSTLFVFRFDAKGDIASVEAPVSTDSWLRYPFVHSNWQTQMARGKMAGFLASRDESDGPIHTGAESAHRETLHSWLATNPAGDSAAVPPQHHGEGVARLINYNDAELFRIVEFGTSALQIVDDDTPRPMPIEVHHDFSGPLQGALSFVSALRARNHHQLAETIALRAPDESVLENQAWILTALKEESPDGELENMLEVLEGFQPSDMNAAKGTGKSGVIFTKQTSKTMYNLTFHMRKERGGWHVADVSLVRAYDNIGQPDPHQRGNHVRPDGAMARVKLGRVIMPKKLPRAELSNFEGPPKATTVESTGASRQSLTLGSILRVEDGGARALVAFDPGIAVHKGDVFEVRQVVGELIAALVELTDDPDENRIGHVRRVAGQGRSVLVSDRLANTSVEARRKLLTPPTIDFSALKNQWVRIKYTFGYKHTSDVVLVRVAAVVATARRIVSIDVDHVRYDGGGITPVRETIHAQEIEWLGVRAGPLGGRYVFCPGNQGIGMGLSRVVDLRYEARSAQEQLALARFDQFEADTLILSQERAYEFREKEAARLARLQPRIVARVDESMKAAPLVFRNQTDQPIIVLVTHRNHEEGEWVEHYAIRSWIHRMLPLLDSFRKASNMVGTWSDLAPNLNPRDHILLLPGMVYGVKQNDGRPLLTSRVEYAVLNRQAQFGEVRERQHHDFSKVPFEVVVTDDDVHPIYRVEVHDPEFRHGYNKKVVHKPECQKQGDAWICMRECYELGNLSDAPGTSTASVFVHNPTDVERSVSMEIEPAPCNHILDLSRIVPMRVNFVLPAGADRVARVEVVKRRSRDGGYEFSNADLPVITDITDH